MTGEEGRAAGGPRGWAASFFSLQVWRFKKKTRACSEGRRSRFKSQQLEATAGGWRESPQDDGDTDALFRDLIAGKSFTRGLCGAQRGRGKDASGDCGLGGASALTRGSGGDERRTKDGAHAAAARALRTVGPGWSRTPFRGQGSLASGARRTSSRQAKTYWRRRSRWPGSGRRCRRGGRFAGLYESAQGKRG